MCKRLLYIAVLQERATQTPCAEAGEMLKADADAGLILQSYAADPRCGECKAAIPPPQCCLCPAPFQQGLKGSAALSQRCVPSPGSTEQLQQQSWGCHSAQPRGAAGGPTPVTSHPLGLKALLSRRMASSRGSCCCLNGGRGKTSVPQTASGWV